MAFHSYQFILGALPLCYAGFLLAYRLGGWTAAFGFLTAASLAFYAQWSVLLLGILLTSVCCNFTAGQFLLTSRSRPRLASCVLITAITLNLLALGYMKYANFFIDIVNIGGAGFTHIDLIVPIGASFYTFIQIGYLIEAYAGRVESPGFARYVLFATFFPCVTAGPLVQQQEMFAQLKDRRDHAFNPATLAAGLTMFSMGLFKKVVFADQLAPYADLVFSASTGGQGFGAVVAWLGAICYALQLYFDFSGYSDMAIGLGCIFGIRLPLNFSSPFRATDISEFWRRWHITMTRFFTAYIYTPMAVRGMRRMQGKEQSGLSRFARTAAIPALTTFLIAGIWHGSGWTFVVYGLIHGIAIAAYLGWSRWRTVPLPPAVGWLLTMSVVVSALVVFRSPDLTSAAKILGTMWSFGFWTHGLPGPDVLAFDVRTALAAVVVLGSIVMLMPNTQEILHRFEVSVENAGAGAAREAGLLAWNPVTASAIAIGLMLCIALGSIGSGTAFLYYQF